MIPDSLKPGDPRRHELSGFHRLDGDYRPCETRDCPSNAVWWVWDYRYENGNAICTAHFKGICHPGPNMVREMLDKCPPDKPYTGTWSI